MPDASIKRHIVQRIMDLLDPLKVQQSIRVIERKTSLFLVEPRRPAIHVVTGHETVLASDEDFRGFMFQFPVFLRCMFETNTDYEWKADDLKALIELKIESDIQLASLCKYIKPEGTLPFVDDISKPDGGFIMTYLVDYRRVKGDPFQTF